jgi:hypothetical protein
MPAERTSPNDTMSRLKPGYFTCLRCSLISSVVTERGMFEIVSK